MKLLLSTCLLSIAVAGSAVAQYKIDSLEALPPALPAAVASALEPHGLQVISPDGKPYCEVWIAKSLPAGPKSVESSVSLPTIPHGAFLGVIRFPDAATDRRGNPVKAGTYSMRYSRYPEDGNHMGVEPQRDFVILIPAAQDNPPNSTPAYDELMTLSHKAYGMPHPGVLSLFPSTAEKLPALEKEGEQNWVLHVTIGANKVGLIVIGKYEG